MSNFWVICGLALLCLGSVKCSRYFPEEDEYFLDKTENSEEVQTEKEEDTEWDLDNTRKLLNEINDVRLLASDDGSDKEVTREVCVLENCKETGGNCSKSETESFQCLCPGSIEYNNETGCNVTDDKCQEEMPSCKKTGGACSIDEDQNIQCDCPASIEYSQDTGCNVTDKKCETVKPNCKKTGGSCSIGKDKNIQCVCPVNTAYSEEKDTGCIDDKCVEECGIRYDEQNEKLKCVGGPFGYVRCICIVQDDKNIDFDYYDKQCKTDYCKVNCGSLQCGYEDKFDENKYECICPNPAYEEFVRTNNTCKINYCKKVCGADERVECDDKYNKDLKVEDCKCNDDGYVYTGKKCTKKCDDDCENEGTCEDKGNYKLCQCKDGTNGDMCENIEDCSGKYKNCIGKRGKCIFENGAAKCSCPKGQVEYFYSCKDDDCIERCGIHHDEQKGKLICVGSPFWVTCTCVDKDDKSIDFDPRDKDCKTNYCHKKCGVLECEGDKFDEDRAKCICPKPFEEFDEEDKKCKVNYCKKFCGADKRVECDDKYNKDIKVEDCKCNDDKYVYFGKKCTKTCDDDCKNEGTCEKKGDFKLCKCEPGTSGDMCENIEDCISGKYKDCKDGKGECKFENKTATCSCPHGKEVIASLNYCEVPCKEDKDCKGPNRMCKAKMFCQCQEGYGGEDCTEVLGCKTLAEKCKQAQAKCVFDKDEREKATCKCNDNFVYNRTKNECKHVFCHPFNPCKEPANCTHDESTGIGYCKCPADKYFNYKAQTCEDLPDKCLMKKIPCGELYDCKKGKCVCKEKVKEGEECKPILCEKGSCFENAKCSKEDGSCYCEETEYFKDKGCKDATCSFEDFKKNCTCPRDTTRKDKEECKASEEKKCTRNCGYGVCVKDKEKEICKCFNFADKNSNGTCILKTMYCEGGKLQEDSMKCKCEGQYTQADDGITCRPKTCKDDDVKKECAIQGAECVPKGKKVGYECKCPTGYVADETDANKKCTEPCSIEKNIRNCAKNGELCFNSLSKSEGYTCSCPPTLTKDNNGKCSINAENGYLISNIFVLKKKYEINGQINTAILNDHLKESLEQTFSDFQSGYVYDFRISGDTLNCSVWVNFNKAPEKTDLDKIKLAAKTLSGDCENCYENAILWPPHLLLSSEGLKNAESSKLEFCSEEVKDIFCGKETKCESNRCSCKDGFKIIQNSLQEIGGNKVLRCEDIDECAKGIHACSANTECVNTFGSYKCVCKEGYKKKETPANPETDKSPCYDMCSPSPCGKGKCVLQGKTFDCECDAGYGGSFCSREDVNYASAKKGTVIVGAVLGTLLILGTIAALYYIIKVKRSGSEDFMPAARMDRAEMTERRPVRGATNRAYE